MSHDLPYSHVALDNHQLLTEVPAHFSYAAMGPDGLAMTNLAHDSELSRFHERRELHQTARSAMGSPHTNSVCQQELNSSRTASPSRPPSRATTPRSRTKTKKVEPDANFVKRPLNSFMLYRKDNQHNIPTNNHQSISRIIGDMWRKETAETKNFYDVRAKEEREKHLLQHPGYKFQPKKKKKETKAVRPELSSRQSSTSVYSNDLDQPSMVYNQPECNRAPLDATWQHFHFPMPRHESQEGSPSRNTPYFARGTNPLQQEEHYPSSGMHHHKFPPHYAHYTEQAQFQHAQMPAEYHDRQDAGVMLRDPQDWNVLSNQYHSAASAALYPQQQGQEIAPPEPECPWPESYNLLDYNMPATFGQWEDMRMADMPIFQEALQTDFTYPLIEQELGYSLVDPVNDELDFIPNHMKHNNDVSSSSSFFVTGEVKDTWELEHVDPQSYPA